LAGRAAEELSLGNISNLSDDALEKAVKLVRKMNSLFNQNNFVFYRQ
jgi:hypothetical protein